MEHQSVLLRESIEGLEISDNDIIVDMTLGGAGHTEGVLKTGAKNLTIIGIDADHEAIERAKERLQKYINNQDPDNQHKFIFENAYFDSLPEILEKNQISHVDKIIFDLGYSSYEIDSDKRGFSFQHEGPLKMTYTQNPNDSQLTADDVVNSFQEENLADIIYGFGEEKFSRRIAKAIVATRELSPIKTTTELAEIISNAVPKFYRLHKDGGGSKIHPATKTFQAIRIAVNSELEKLKTALNQSFEVLNLDGRMAVISFHSLEDRIVKRFFKEKVSSSEGLLINKKPIVPEKSEKNKNPRSRSAKLRIIQKTLN
jgi:16S rRNA (cytosine1402-N4)-methyltransferase